MRRAVLVLVLLITAFALKGALLIPPAPPQPNASAGEFDTDRARDRLERILGNQRPHPVDTPANDAVRERLIAELRALGLNPAVRTAPNCNALPGFSTVSCSLTRNVVALIGGERPGKALLLNAHYDSTPAGPGAADDGIGVATMLEVAAKLRVRPPAQPVILLFNEGEEFGLNGAAAFAASDPLADRVGSLINLEARGVSGPAWMFETSEPNRAPIAAFQSAARRPYANSLSADFAKLIPNYTDVVVFKPERNWNILSFAVVGNEARYHTPGDRVEHLERSSLYHMGSQVLAAARTLPAASGPGELVYSDVAGGRLFFAMPLILAEILLGVLIGGALFLAWRKRAFGRALLACAAAVAAGTLIAVMLAWTGSLARPGDYWRAWPLVTYLALYSGLLAAMTALVSWLGATARPNALRAACWLLILLAGGALSTVVHGATIFFLLPPALGLTGIAIPRARLPLLWAAALVQLLMFAQLLAAIEMLLIDGPLWAGAPLAALAALPFLVEIARAPLKRPALGLALLAAALWVGSLVLPRSSDRAPAAFTIDYVRDDSEKAAHWGVASKQAPLPGAFDQLGEWRRGLLAHNGRRRWIAEAPLIEIPAASVETVAERPTRRGRQLRLRLSGGGADTLMLRFADEVAVTAIGLPGKMQPIPDAEDEPAILRCSGRACDGLEIEVALASGGPAAAELVAATWGLPREGARLQALRPRNAQPQYGTDGSYRVTDVTL